MKNLTLPICMGVMIVSHTFAQAQVPANQLAAVSTKTITSVAARTRSLTREQYNAQTARQNAIDVDYEDMLGKLNITDALTPVTIGVMPKYDANKNNPYAALPNALIFNDGTKVKNAADWQKRRAEIMEDFDREVYGRVPSGTPGVKWVVEKTVNETVGGVAVNTKYLTGKVRNPSNANIEVNIKFVLSVPANAKKAVPVVIQYDDLTNQNANANWKTQVAKKGWGYAVLDPNSIQPDNGGDLTKGVIGLVNEGHFRKPDDWGALRAIAWGADRALDYLATNPAVNAKQVAIEGNGRWGEAALATLAYNPRMATAYVSTSADGGAKLHRINSRQLEDNGVNSNDYHWMAGNYIRFASNKLTFADLSVDTHELIALCAPRPVFIGTSGDAVARNNAQSSFIAADAAGPVYTLLGKQAIKVHAMPKAETLLNGDVAFRQHTGKDSDAPNWTSFLAFADKYFK